LAASLARLRVGMADRLEDVLRASTVRVLGGPAAGRGFSWRRAGC
jgi:hypothetical protein